ncbi:MAG: 3-deoxy-D-manno-octulosonic acid transferase, partial [Sedimentisphaerales bacterium]
MTELLFINIIYQMGFVLDFLYLLAAAAYSPVVVYRIIRYNRYRTGWAQRFGKITRKNPQKKCVWLHAVSVGELNAAKTIVKELQDRFSHFEIVVSTTTDTGMERATKLFAENLPAEHSGQAGLQVFYFPLDFSWIMRRAFRRIRPSLCLLMELEVWPNFVQIAEQLKIPVVVVNGRISDKSFSRYKKIKPIAKKIFHKVSLILAQTEEYAQRFRELGCDDERVIVTGSLKYDTAQITDKVDGSDALAKQLNIGNEDLWVAGATGPGEEKIILEVYNYLTQPDQFENLRLVIVPRKPERFDEVAHFITDAHLDFLRYSSIK